MPTRNDHADSSLNRTARKLALTGWALLLVTYTLIFWFFSSSEFLDAFQRAAINTVPAALLSWPVARLVERHLIDAMMTRQIVGHLVLALGFALFWYIGIQTGYGLQDGLPADGIVGRALNGVALTWQLFQGVTIYAVIALFAYAVTFRTRLDALELKLERIEQAEASGSAEPVADKRQIFVKDGKALKPVLISDIMMLSGAGDYTEVLTADGTFLSGTSLSQFETELPSVGFLRVHRSHIVATDAILSVESGGNGRLTLHMPRGHSVTTSRAGAARLKGRAL
ncbi:LytR/AlgR family response regulator transcription factor [Algimonas porphyrae]|uniref:LytTR family transcriptional regulator n=1 Tax=Algimonas porphyrae TaxID=1128113 RepID=A0ABQ5UYE5_9PROT|nr:LytTR family DNA-binding domain-containing protein [Algimonas porphyrae]GLQ19765.1 LytTR family transcriptional regulator [Algimonas porphyrae]